ncbi:MAG: hypothetical protein IJU58_01050 [Clostridia bacterium]|nr:hypothetical protein [Clostridia bacterium]
MKKSIIITILLVYLASIIIVGFFGISVKVYDVVKYVQSIEMSVEGSDPETFTWVDTTKEDSNHTYTLTVHFNHASEGPVADKDGNVQNKLFVGLNLIPQVTYTSGDLGAEEPIEYRLTETGEKYVENGYFTLSEYGTLMLFQAPFVATIYIEPQNYGSINAGAVVTLRCLNK